ncbi:hypothetical protein GMRT_11129 [Giardia muris]|uniref:Uncharacterized protein n=1 Tax=Giardia muris TaxID=5742 RepID=A0A4Z1SZP7_GIAMU|nr:hypothetical protein GMRT_11129 [Giardia muris]|eukprot:TNJ28928.1 hypothetical protein GMRT_11129 [Giardia muris]
MLERVAGHYINLCHARHRYCSFAHLSHHGFTLSDIYRDSLHLPIEGGTGSRFEPLIVSLDVQYSISEECGAPIGPAVRALVLLLKERRRQTIELDTYLMYCEEQGLSAAKAMSGYEAMRHHGFLVPMYDRWKFTLPMHRALIDELETPCRLLKEALLRSPNGMHAWPSQIQYVPHIPEHTSQEYDSPPANMVMEHGLDFHLGALVGDPELGIYTTETSTVALLVASFA